MQITHTVKLLGAQQYEMVHFSYTVSAEDMPESLKKEVTTVQLWRIIEYVVQREIINLQIQSGHMTLDAGQGRIEYLRRCLGDLSEKLVPNGL